MSCRKKDDENASFVQFLCGREKSRDKLCSHEGMAACPPGVILCCVRVNVIIKKFYTVPFLETGGTAGALQNDNAAHSRPDRAARP